MRVGESIIPRGQVDYTRPVITREAITPRDSWYYPFCTLRCGWRYAKRAWERGEK
jgi:hypothetical protein